MYSFSSSDRSCSRRAQASTALAITVSLATASAWAQDVTGKTAAGLEEVIVTAEKRAESVQSMPIAISAYSPEALVSRGVEGVGGLQFLAPSVQIGSPFSGFAQVNIRGVGSSFFGLGAEGAAAVSQDDVGLVSMQTFNTDFLDVERVEVLRGPQGTLGGRLATAGAINVYSKRPTDELEGGLKATTGSFDRLAIEGYLSGPVAGDRLMARLAVRSDRDDGWLRNTLLNENLDATDKMQVRGSLLARPSDNFDALLILDAHRDRSNSIYQYNLGRARPDVPSADEVWPSPGLDHEARTIAVDQRTRSDAERYLASLNLNWDLGPSANLSTTTGYVQYERSQFWDNDATQEPVVVQNPDIVPTYDLWQASQEVTLTADLTDRLDMIVGANYLRHEGTQDSGGGRPLLGVPLYAIRAVLNLDLTSWAAYTQWRYRLTDNLRLTAGARYTEDSKEFEETRTVFGVVTSGSAEHSWSVTTPRFSIDYMPTDDLTLYATVSRGYKPGGWNGITDRFNPENVWNYEAGVKASMLDKRFNATLTGFYMDNSNLQQLVTGLDPVDPTRAFTINANSAAIKGVELELDALITERFRLTGSGTWLSAHYDELRTTNPLYPELGVQDLSGNQVVRAPDWQFNLAGEYRAPLTDGWQAVLSASFAWQDKIFFDFYNNPLLTQDAYGLVNLLGTIQSDDAKWQFSAFVNNLTDEVYLTRMQVGTLGAARTLLGLPASRPRTYGISLAYRF